MRRGALTVLTIDGAGLMVAAGTLALLRDPHLAATVWAAVPVIPLPWLLAGPAALLLVDGLGVLFRRRSRAAAAAGFVFAEERRIWAQGVMARGDALPPSRTRRLGRRLPRPGPLFALAAAAAAGVGIGTAVSDRAAGAALGVAAGVLLAALRAMPPGATGDGNRGNRPSTPPRNDRAASAATAGFGRRHAGR
jgi:hypothetical protein